MAGFSLCPHIAERGRGTGEGRGEGEGKGEREEEEETYGISSSFIQTPILSDQGFPLTISFNLYHLLKGPISKYGHVRS